MPARGTDNGHGFLEVGSNYEGEVVINLPYGMTGHINFTPQQARSLAETLTRKADEAESMMSALIQSAKRKGSSR